MADCAPKGLLRGSREFQASGGQDQVHSHSFYRRSKTQSWKGAERILLDQSVESLSLRHSVILSAQNCLESYISIQMLTSVLMRTIFTNVSCILFLRSAIELLKLFVGLVGQARNRVSSYNWDMSTRSQYREYGAWGKTIVAYNMVSMQLGRRKYRECTARQRRHRTRSTILHSTVELFIAEQSLYCLSCKSASFLTLFCIAKLHMSVNECVGSAWRRASKQPVLRS